VVGIVYISNLYNYHFIYIGKTRTIDLVNSLVLLIVV